MDEHLKYIIDHVFLSPKLPQEDDNDATKNASLTEEVLAALRQLQSHVPEQHHSEWTPCIQMVSNMIDVRDRVGELIAENVEIMLGEMLDRSMN